MELANGVKLEVPDLVLPWHTRPETVQRIVGEGHMHKATDKYWVFPCVALGGLQMRAGLHFTPALQEVEFFEISKDGRYGALELRASYDLFQQHLVASFGEPDLAEAGSIDPAYPSYTWYRQSVLVRHFVHDRNGPEEHVRIKT